MSNNLETRSSAGGLTLRSTVPVKQGATLMNRLQGGRKKRLLYAAEKGDLALVQALIKRGVDVNAAKNMYGMTALMWASEKGHMEILRELLAQGANVNAARTTDGCTALLFATQHGQTEIVHELLERGADLNAAIHVNPPKEINNDWIVGARTKNGTTPLILASHFGHLEIVRALLNKGANVNASTDDGKTALMWASENGNLEIVRELLNKSPNVNAVISFDTTIERTRAMTMSRINRIEDEYKRMKVNHYNGMTALMLASENDNLEIVHLLCEHGADPNIVDKRGRKAIDYADSDGLKELLSKGCSSGTNVAEGSNLPSNSLPVLSEVKDSQGGYYRRKTRNRHRRKHVKRSKRKTRTRR